MNYKKEQLEEAHIALLSTLKKCEKIDTSTFGKSQKTLLERRIRALRLALELIEKERGDNTHKAFSALYGDNPQILILGTFPSVKSRESNGYYGNPQNQFWRIIAEIFSEKIDFDDYEQKKAMIFKHGIALWDTLISCEIKGSADTNIKNEVGNTEIPVFVKYFNINKVLFNSKKAFNFYCRYNGLESLKDIEYHIMPSTSSAYAGMNFKEKVSVWREKLT
ncbi:MAG: DNA-deoxyinosine glycosylase [Oscillospiraceae bacterium]|nr:DNA-deoxyinosine glycosylase [Oscillospiraceae bacterium]